MSDDTDAHFQETTIPPAPRSAHTGVRRSVMTLIGLAAFLFIFGKVMPQLFPTHRPETAPADIKDNTPGLPERMSQLEAKIKTLEDALAAAPKPSTNTDARIAALQEKVDALQQQAQHPSSVESEHDAKLDTTLKDLQAQIGDLQSQQKGQLSALAAFAALKDAIMRGEPYEDTLATLTKLTSNNIYAQALLKKLVPGSKEGALMLPSLQELFEKSIPKTLAHAHSNALTRDLQSLIRIRKVGQPQGNDDESVIARAETRLNRGEIDASIKELQGLSAPAADAMANWVSRAQEFLEIRRVLSALQPAIMETGQPPAPAPEPDTAATP